MFVERIGTRRKWYLKKKKDIIQIFYQNYNRMAEKGLRIKCFPGVTGLLQLPVCFAMLGAGFNFDDLSSTVIFLYAYHYIMMALKALIRFFFHQDCNEDGCLPIEIFNSVTRFILQIWGLSAVSIFVWHRGTSILGEVFNLWISRATQQLLCSKSHDFLAAFALKSIKLHNFLMKLSKRFLTK